MHYVIYFLVEGGVAGKCGGIVQKWHARFLSFLKKLRDEWLQQWALILVYI